MTETIEAFLFYIAFCCDILLIALFFIFFKRFKREFPIYIIIANTLFALLITWAIEIFPANGRFFYTFFTFFEYSFFAFFIYLNILNKAFKKLILGISIIFTIFIFSYHFLADFRNVDSVPIGIESIFILIFSFYYLYEQMSDLNTEFVYNKYQFWIVIGMMIYLAGSFFIYLFANQVDKKTLHEYWFLTNVFYILKNILFAIAILIFLKQSARLKNPSPKNFQPYLN